MATIQVAPLGLWKGYTSNGIKESVSITSDIVLSCVEYFNSHNVQVPVDWEHQTVSGLQAPAAGWITRLYDGGKDGLMAVVTWNKDAEQQIKSKQYKYLSPVLVYDATDNVTGEKVQCYLHSAALTNTPFLDGIKEVTAKISDGATKFMCSSVAIIQSSLSKGTTMEDFISKLIELLGLEADAADNPQSILDEIAEWKQKLAGTGESEAKEGEGDKTEEVTAKEGEVAEEKTAEMSNKGVLGTVITLSKRIAELERNEQLRNAESLLNEYKDKLTPVLKESFMSMAMTNPKQARTILAALPKVMPDPLKAKKIETDAIALSDKEEKMIVEMKLDRNVFIEEKRIQLKKEAANG